MRSQSKEIFVAGCILKVWREVYEPAEDSFLFAESMNVRLGSHVLDMGTGCGILGILAAKRASEVLAIDINPYAVRCAKGNAVLNGIDDKMLFLQGDLFTPIDSDVKFDLIIFNAPYLPFECSGQVSWLERAWTGGVDGRQVIDRFLREGPKHLKSDSEIMLMQSNLSGINETLRALRKRGLRTCIVADRSLPFFETISLIRASKKEPVSF
jgi:release factor glutamine methyltransferase